MGRRSATGHDVPGSERRRSRDRRLHRSGPAGRRIPRRGGARPLPGAGSRFLLTTSIADRVSAALANELTGRSDGQLVLERLTRPNALLVGLAGSTEWFRFHPMLRDLLAHRLALEQPGGRRDLHLRASQWFAGHGEPIHAIRHAAAGEHWDEAGRLLTAIAWPIALDSQRSGVGGGLGTGGRSGDELIRPPGRLLACAVRDLHRRDFESMIRATDAADELLADVPDARSEPRRGPDRPAAGRLFPDPRPRPNGTGRRPSPSGARSPVRSTTADRAAASGDRHRQRRGRAAVERQIRRGRRQP